jgi:hypothetical protein
MRLMKLQTYSTIKNRRDHHLAVFHQDEKPASPVLGCLGVSRARYQTQFIGHRLGKRAFERMSHVKSFKGI